MLPDGLAWEKDVEVGLIKSFALEGWELVNPVEGILLGELERGLTVGLALLILPELDL